ncbi:MAG: response regulator [Bacteroidetes bacterium]|nr:response regulator [Bacteroidota bacterium]
MSPSINSILLVDDDQDYKYFFYKAIEKVDPSINVTTAADGIEAFSKLESAIPDLIILDFNMPRMNGLAFLKDIKKNQALKHIPVIIYSTFLSMFDSNEFKVLGAVHVYTKPVGFSETIDTVNEILKRTGDIRKCA